MKQKRFIKLTQDLMFKSFFSKDEKVLISLLKSFLPALQDKQIENIQILNPENESSTTRGDNSENKYKKRNDYKEPAKYKTADRHTENDEYEKMNKGGESAKLQKDKTEKTKDKARQEIGKDKMKTKPELISLDSSLYPRSFSKKQITLDLRLKLNTGENINVEMQSLSQTAFLERILFYWARLYTEDLKRGEGYEKLYPAYSLVFTDFHVLPARLTDYINSFSIRLDKQPYEELTNHLKIVIVELSKFKYESLQNLDKKASWCYVLKKSENLHETELEILSKKGLGGAMALLKNVSESDRLRYEQESRDKFLFDQRWDRIYKFEEGKKEGIEEGLQKGIQKGREEALQKSREEKEKIILNMLKLNADFDFISKVTGLTKEEIKKLQSKKKQL